MNYSNHECRDFSVAPVLIMSAFHAYSVWCEVQF